MERANPEVISWGNLTSRLCEDKKLEAASKVASNSFTVFSSRFSPTMSFSVNDLAVLDAGALGSLDCGVAENTERNEYHPTKYYDHHFQFNDPLIT